MKKTISALTLALALVAGAATVSAMPNVDTSSSFDWETVFAPQD